MSETNWIRQAGDVLPDEEHEGFTLRGRAARAEHAVEQYNTIRGALDFAASDVSDLLTDLHHLCDREGWDWNAALARAWRNYDAEINRYVVESSSSPGESV